MARPSHREKILTEGLRVVHERGFAGASVRDIVQAAGVPQGSFTNHFASKEAFGLEVIDLYAARAEAIVAATLRNDALPPLQRLEAYIDAVLDRGKAAAMRNGCLLGNFAAEACTQSEAMRARLIAAFGATRDAVADCLAAARAAGAVPADLDIAEVAGFVVEGLQGATLLAKAERSAAPMERFKRILFGRVLR